VRHHVGGGALAELDLDPREAAVELAQQGRQVEVPRGEEGADGDRPADQPPQLVQVRAHSFGLGQRRARPADRDPARAGESDRAGRALEELDSQLFLEPAHLMRDGGLRDVQLLGGAREVAVPDDGLEISELAQLHG
jgi:hypothetical protein